MVEAVDQSRHAIVLAALVALALAAAPAQAPAQGPGVDEYTLRGPAADRPGHVGPKAPVSRPEALPAEVRRELASVPEGETLTEIATARELGAPKVLASSSAPDGRGQDDADADDRSTVTGATASALTSAPGLGLLAALIIVGAAAFLLRRRTNGASA